LVLKKLMAWSVPVAAAAGAALLLLFGGRHEPVPDTAAASVAAPGIAVPSATMPTADPNANPNGEAPPQAEIVSSTDIVVGHNDTLDAIFGRMALDKADLAAIRNLPGVRQSIDSLKPGDVIHLQHVAGAIRELTRKLSESQTLVVTRVDGGFTTHVLDNPVEHADSHGGSSHRLVAVSGGRSGRHLRCDRVEACEHLRLGHRFRPGYSRWRPLHRRVRADLPRRQEASRWRNSGR
jgi:hypothetical protein